MYFSGLMRATQVNETVYGGFELNKEHKLIPKSSSFVLGHFDIDTASLIQILVPRNRGPSLYAGNISFYQQELWGTFFFAPKIPSLETRML